MRRRVTIWITGYNPEQWTVGTAQVGRKGGKHFARIGKDRRLEDYQTGIREDIKAACPDLQQFPKGTQLLLEFGLWRHLEQYRSPKSDRMVTRHRADTTNLSKALEDALGGRPKRGKNPAVPGVLYENDVDNWATLPFRVIQAKNIQPLIIVIATDWPDHWERKMTPDWGYLYSIRPQTGEPPIKYLEESL